MMFGKLRNVLQLYNPWNVTGLNITLAQTTYNVHIHIDNSVQLRLAQLFFLVQKVCMCGVLKLF